MRLGQTSIFENRLLKKLSVRVSKREEYKIGKSSFRFGHMTRKYGQDERRLPDRKKYKKKE